MFGSFVALITALLVLQGCVQRTTVRKVQPNPQPKPPDAYASIERMFEAFVGLKISDDMSNQAKQQQLQNKRKLLDIVTTRYQKYIAASAVTNTWTVQAYCRVGDSFWHAASYYHTLKPDPKELQAQVLLVTKKVLLKKGIPEKAHDKVLARPRFQAMLKRLSKKAMMQYLSVIRQQSEPALASAKMWYKRCIEQANMASIKGPFVAQAAQRAK